MKQNVTNPFVLQPYVREDLFCDRKAELETLISCIENGRNVSLISMRRLGKTGLIYRAFELMREKKYGYTTVYADIYATSSLEDFIATLSEAVVAQCGESGIKRFFSALGGIRPLLSYDPITGTPQVSITYRTESEKYTTLKSVFDYLEGLGRKVVVAIDEFQQIREYEGVKMEALLRSYIQNLQNVRFIFCGSKKHLMVDMFVGERSPFYQSATNIPLSKLDKEVYSGFIMEKFSLYGKTITRDIVDYVIDWSRCHTFYTQTLCNTIFMLSGKDVLFDDVYASINAIFESEKDRFFTIRNMLTPGQWRYLAAVAKEGSVCHPTASQFLLKYKIGTPASSNRYLASLLEKELLLEESSQDGKEYFVYNVFLSRWLETFGRQLCR